MSAFSPESFRLRRARVLERMGQGALLLPAAPVLHRSRDTEHRYRPDSELYYLTGCAEPGVVAVLRGGSCDQPFLLFVPRRDPGAERWTGPRLGPEEARERFGSDAVYPAEEMDEKLPSLLKEVRQIFFRLGVDPRLESLVVGSLREARNRGARKGDGPRGVTDPGQLLDELRLRKDPEEVALIRRAADLTVSAFRETLPRVRPGMGEWEVEALLDSAFRRRGAAGPAFPTIVGSGANGCVLHYSANGSRIESGSLVLLDGGAEMELYAGDLTRTIPAGRAFTPEQRAVYEVVLAARAAALGAIRPGAPADGVHAAAVMELTAGLRELGVLSGGLEDLLRAKAFEPHFPHQTSHWLGLDVHDPGEYVLEGRSRPLEAGMVLTVEPGLYFAAGAGADPHPFRGIGVRIEDDILITGDGWENLSASLPVEAAELEDLVGSALQDGRVSGQGAGALGARSAPKA